MVFYNSKNELENIDYIKYDSIRGGVSHLFLIDPSTLFKVYFSYTDSIVRIGKKEFEILKDINNPNFVKLYDYYTKEENSDVIDAYTLKYYSEDEVSLLYKTMDFILSNIYEIEKVFSFLTDNHIIIADVKKANVINTRLAIVMVDPDCFTYCPYIDKNELRRMNIDSLKILLMSLLINGCYSSNLNKYLCSLQSNEFNITDSLSKNFSKKKRLIDLLKQSE